MNNFKYKKSVQALNFFASLGGGKIQTLKVLKLLWLADRLHLRKYGRTITGDNYFALPHGPVATQTKDLIERNPDYLGQEEIDYCNKYLSKKKDHHIISKGEVDIKVLSRTDLDILRKIQELYGKMDQYKLRDFSHQFPEWVRFEDQLGDSRRAYQMHWSDFFKDSDDNPDIFKQDSEHLSMSEEAFKSKLVF